VFIVHDLGVAVLFCIVTMLGWGSWANTQKLAGKDRWPFELFYWDYAIGVFAFSVLFALTLGNAGASGMPSSKICAERGTVRSGLRSSAASYSTFRIFSWWSPLTRRAWQWHFRLASVSRW
jgi:hypothetical protein